MRISRQSRVNQFSFAGRKITIKNIENAVSNMQDVSDVCPAARPWLEPIYDLMYKPVQTWITLNHRALNAVVDAVGDQGVLIHEVPAAHLRAGDRVSRIETNRDTRHDAMIFKRAREVTRVSQKVVDVVKIWQKLMASCNHTRSTLPLPVFDAPGAADAFATKDNFGIGGWIACQANPRPAECFWFSLLGKVSDIPAKWGIGDDAQKAIASFEMLAKVGLIKMRGLQCRANRIAISIHYESDNLAVAAACNRLFTMKQPLSTFLRLPLMTAQKFHFEVDLAHEPGVLNDWADGLSRGGETLMSVFAPEKRSYFLLHELLVDHIEG